jgi:hypothetical protein
MTVTRAVGRASATVNLDRDGHGPRAGEPESVPGRRDRRNWHVTELELECPAVTVQLELSSSAILKSLTTLSKTYNLSLKACLTQIIDSSGPGPPAGRAAVTMSLRAQYDWALPPWPAGGGPGPGSL